MRALSWGAGLAILVVFVQADIREFFDEVIDARRSFFALRVYDEDVGTKDHKRGLVHGTTIHGAQFMNTARRREPITSSEAFLEGIETQVDPWLPEEELGSLWTDDYSNVLEVIRH